MSGCCEISAQSLFDTFQARRRNRFLPLLLNVADTGRHGYPREILRTTVLANATSSIGWIKSLSRTPVPSVEEGEEAAVPTMSSFKFLNLVHKCG